MGFPRWMEKTILSIAGSILQRFYPPALSSLTTVSCPLRLSRFRHNRISFFIWHFARRTMIRSWSSWDVYFFFFSLSFFYLFIDTHWLWDCASLGEKRDGDIESDGWAQVRDISRETFGRCASRGILMSSDGWDRNLRRCLAVRSMSRRIRMLLRSPVNTPADTSSSNRNRIFVANNAGCTTGCLLFPLFFVQRGRANVSVFLFSWFFFLLSFLFAVDRSWDDSHPSGCSPRSRHTSREPRSFFFSSKNQRAQKSELGATKGTAEAEGVIAIEEQFEWD